MARIIELRGNPFKTPEIPAHSTSAHRLPNLWATGTLIDEEPRDAHRAFHWHCGASESTNHELFSGKRGFRENSRPILVLAPRFL
jgi:hypothetical protein